MTDTRNLCVVTRDSSSLQVDKDAGFSAGTVSLLVEGRLLRDCISAVLQRPDRTIQGHCLTLGKISENIATLTEPDLVIASLATSEMGSAFETIRSIRSHWPHTRWIVLTRVADRDFIRDGLKSGVNGFLLEDSPVEVLRLVTDLVLLGHSPLPAEFARLLVEEPPSLQPGDTEPAAPIIAHPIDDIYDGASPVAPIVQRTRSLSERELDILRCLSQGMSNKVIARELAIAEATVKAHVKALLRKMQVSNRTQAAIRATQMHNLIVQRPPAPCGLDEPAPASPNVAAMAAVVRRTGLQAVFGL